MTTNQDHTPRVFESDGITIIELTGDELVSFLETGALPGQPADPTDTVEANALRVVHALRALSLAVKINTPEAWFEVWQWVAQEPRMARLVRFALETSANAIADDL